MSKRVQVTATPWLVWQLADDRTTYGDDAGKYILVTPDGETEHPAGIIYPSYDDAQRDADTANARLQPLHNFNDGDFSR